MAININPNLLRNSANNLDTVVSTLNEVNNGMKRAHGDIASCWQSNLTPEYLEHFEDVRSKVADLMIEIQSIQAALKNAAIKAEQAEREARAIVTNNSTERSSDSSSSVMDAIKKINQQVYDTLKDIKK